MKPDGASGAVTVPNPAKNTIDGAVKTIGTKKTLSRYKNFGKKFEINKY